MSLSNLKLVTAHRPVPAFRANPTDKARAAVLANIEVQRALVMAERGEAVALTKTVKKQAEDGSTITTTVSRKPRKWFWKNPQGQFVVEMLFANQPVIIANGKSAIEAVTLDGVDTVLNTLAEAVANGELDKALADAKAKRKPTKKKAA
ncbi:conserved protein of unknown function [Magnetospirillum gryphiswaldense MSR-1 v2]|uniref:Uncharacterized protein n=1 Tax=Magnetospirillum gryphiswaldense (strain DSM 6361 / JCM 21280 / NBRC 15271 / MSR-1) TaxID=431944 RepID=V6F447_MAGGM|nr:hypothetical protein [Magnetospirillum gryphiswaldense]CDL00270.1 conserved protein of unknown function [Magnetospirillum gryphiswaldense MSR-1 v2]